MPTPWRLHAPLLVFSLLVLALNTSAAAPPAPTIEAPAGPATAGFYRLAWTGPADGPTRFQLIEARDAQFTQAFTAYVGEDQARVFSGRPDGTYYYRLRALPEGRAPSAWSRPVAVTVAHHALPRAWTFFGAGAVVFLATLGLIVTGAWRDYKDARP